MNMADAPKRILPAAGASATLRPRPARVDHARPVSRLVSALGLLTLAFVVLPLPFIVLYSFSKSNYALFSSAGFTLDWFRRFFENERFTAALVNSLMVSVITTVAAVLIALPTALLAVRHRFRGRDLLIGLVSAPLLVPGVITGTAALSFVSETRIGTGFWPITAAMICFTLPLVLRPLVANLSGLDPDLEKAARNLGAGPRRAFWTITVAQLVPGLVAGGTFAFVEAMDNFSITVFLTNITTTTLPVEAYSYIRDIDDPTVAAMATLLIAMSVALVFAIERVLGLDRFLDMS
ncbi:MAG TPA: ABC transporter permease [Ramlibacter sp.]|uniref:ABC transporter permease n=1 Tax=Ramlibacter sp. TaxID=1917967 RepID=UPI002CD8A7BF|nr:ABC transporter permease [Ramlibacter sp.]HVZ45177.1 ABC transporter permease [Ramlibacter sp.]